MNYYISNINYIKNHKKFNFSSEINDYNKKFKTTLSKENIPGLISLNNNKRTTIHSNYYPLNEAKKWAESINIQNDSIIIFGLGLGYYCNFISALNIKEVYIIEPDKYLFMKALHYTDFTKLSNCTFFIGYNEFEIYKLLPKTQIVIFQPVYQLYKNYFDNIMKRINGELIYPINNHWKYPKFKNENTKVLFIDCSYVLSRECIAGLEMNNCIVKYLHLNQTEFDYNIFFKNLLSVINSFKPDFVLTINHLGFDAEGRLTELFESLELPFASWFVDSPNVILSTHNNNISDFCSIFVWEKDYIPEVKKNGFKNVHYLPLATLPQVFKPLNTPYLYDVSFVGSSMVNAIQKNTKRLITNLELLSALKLVADTFLNKNHKFISEVIEDLINKGNKIIFRDVEERKDFEAAALWMATQKYRLSGIKKLSNFYPKIHGDSGWDYFLDFRFNIGRELLYYEHLPEFFSISKINFNMTSCQMNNAVNQRVFDVAACKKFLLTDYKSQLNEIFNKDEMVYFNSVDEIPDLITFYLKNEKKRENIAEKAYNKVINYHTYKDRLKILIEQVKINSRTL